ncbi:hypothetical protein SAMN02745132_04768, partial [Enterovibrio nigricans DSM 22720]
DNLGSQRPSTNFATEPEKYYLIAKVGEVGCRLYHHGATFNFVFLSIG